MRRIAVLGIATALVGVGAAVTTTASASDDVPSARHGQARSCQGVWNVQVNRGPQVPPLKLLLAAHADNTATIAEAAAQRGFVPGGPDVEFNSTSLGVWRATGDRSCTVKVKTLSADIEGRDSGSAVIRGTVRVSPDGRKLAGTGEVTTTLPPGEGSGSTVGGLAISGTRFTL